MNIDKLSTADARMASEPRKLRLAAWLVAACVPVAALAASPEASETPKAEKSSAQPAAPAQKESERVICRRVDGTGMRTRATRVCMTRAEWRRLDN